MQHQIDGALSDPANSAYFKFGTAWLQLCFDGSTIFWRHAEKPEAPVNEQLSSVLVLVDLNEMRGVVGSVLEGIHYRGSASQVSAHIQFASGAKLVFTHLIHGDVTLVAVV